MVDRAHVATTTILVTADEVGRLEALEHFALVFRFADHQPTLLLLLRLTRIPRHTEPKRVTLSKHVKTRLVDRGWNPRAKLLAGVQSRQRQKRRETVVHECGEGL